MLIEDVGHCLLTGRNRPADMYQLIQAFAQPRPRLMRCNKDADFRHVTKSLLLLGYNLFIDIL